jgi:hypothetical protein
MKYRLQLRLVGLKEMWAISDQSSCPRKKITLRDWPCQSYLIPLNGTSLKKKKHVIKIMTFSKCFETGKLPLGTETKQLW